MDAIDLIPLAFIAVIVIVWINMRRRAPHLIGLGKDRNRQKLDHVRLESCQVCGDGFMEPYFRWWRYFFSFGISPAFIYVLGQPDEYRCTGCGNTSRERRSQRRTTRISLSQNLPIAYVVSQIAILVLGAAIVLFIVT